MKIEKLEILLNIQRAETAKMELEYKIEKNKEEIKRLIDHIELQNKSILENKEKLKLMGEINE